MGSLTRPRALVLALALMTVGALACVEGDTTGPGPATHVALSIIDSVPCFDSQIQCFEADESDEDLIADFGDMISNSAQHCQDIKSGFEDAIDNDMIHYFRAEDLRALGDSTTVSFYDPYADVIAFSDSLLAASWLNVMEYAFEEADHWS